MFGKGIRMEEKNIKIALSSQIVCIRDKNMECSKEITDTCGGNELYKGSKLRTKTKWKSNEGRGLWSICMGEAWCMLYYGLN